MTRFIPVSEPNLCGNEEQYVLDCLRSTWISSRGEYIQRFEDAFSEYLGVEHSVTTSNGTTALHLILNATGIGPGDEVIVPTLTYVACANAITYVGAKPIFVDCDPIYWNMTVESVENAINAKTKAVMAVHLYGSPIDMVPLKDICRRHNILLIEDAAEALGSESKGVRAGNMGDVSAFSFFGNKTMTTGEGGMVSTNDSDIADRIRRLKNQGQSTSRSYWHDLIGFNYRMTNIQAAIGLAQMENLENLVGMKRQNAGLYQNYLTDPEIQHSVEAPNSIHSYWMYSILLRGTTGPHRNEFVDALKAKGIETRNFFYPIHTLPMYANEPNASFPVAEDIASRGINLPSSTRLSEEDVIYVCNLVNETLGELQQKHG